MLHAAVEALLSANWTTAPAAELTETVVGLEADRRRLEAVDQRLLAEVAERGLAGEYCRYSPAELLVTLLRVSPTEAKARVTRAQDLGPRRALTGEPLEPILPVTAEAVAAGEISSGHVGVIADCLDRIPAYMSHEVSPVAERMLVEAARHEHPRQLAKTAALLIARLDPDGAAPKDEEQQRRRAFALREHPDGSSTPTGYFPPELTAMWKTVLNTLSAPTPASDGMPDERSPAQRRADAMADAAGRLLRSGDLPASGGAPVTIIATTTLAELQAGVGMATTGTGQQLPISRLLQLSAEARIIPLVCNDAGGVLAYGRDRRLASTGQRLALAARDGGCSFPGCDRPAAWTEVHHILAWLSGGTTDLDNMCLLCRFHHREFERRGWEAVMIEAVPHWIPPAFIDPDRRPIRNTAHHQRDLDFTAAG